MKRLLLLILVALSIGLATVFSASQDRTPENDRNQFVGAWRLIRLEEPDARGEVHEADCTGLLVFSRDGHMSVQVAYRNPPPTGNTAPVQYAKGGYEASYGTYVIKDAHTFTFHVEGALVQALVGKDLDRQYDLSGKQLVVSSSSSNEHWRVVWEHY
jgi:hypothetical protein